MRSKSIRCEGEGEGDASVRKKSNHPSLMSSLNSDKETGNVSLVARSQARQSFGGSVQAMSGYSPSMRQSSHSPQSGTDADSAIGADSSTSPELRHETDFPEDGGEHFECFGENNGTDFER